ncbi:S-layer homology domain-containing protein [Paenibacillus albidus]|uniref:Ig-like domain-containing protein n=1 Tax=Paenibacillus albidus TaxID=2041023 RepID=UPI001BEC919D|nr:Ig-like domain-containing protein [Paenibacillus albidus]MBT2291398.1 S-layer homology domain-containing protein [Paenibacillus albidus]
MLSQRHHRKWNKRLGMLLTTALLFGSFSSTVAPQASAAPVGTVPGGGGAAPVLWLKADDGVTASRNDLTGWEDRSPAPVTFQLNVPNGSKIPQYNEGGVNFNPSVKFDNPTNGGHYNSSAKLLGDKKITFQSGYAVYKWPEAGSAGTVVGSSDPKSSNGVIVLGGYGNSLSVGPGVTNLFSYIPIDKTPDRYRLVNYEIAAGGHSARVDGQNASFSRANNFDRFEFTPSIGATDGAAAYNWYGLKSDVAEIILYDEITSADAAKIETYLAVKYGITLNSDYTGTDGTLLWSKTDNAAYHQNVAGIGKDALEDLDQKQSRSVNTGTQIAVGLAALADTNKGNKGSFLDKQYLIWGDNGQELTFTKQIGTSDLYSAERVWKVQNTGTVGQVQLAVPKDAVPQEAQLLVGSSDTDFTSAVKHPLKEIMINGVAHYAAQVTLADGQYFTFAAPAPKVLSAVLTQDPTNGNQITLTFDQEVELTDLTGFTTKVGNDVVTIDFKVDPTDAKKLILTLPTGTDITGKTVNVSYDGSGNLKGKSGAPVQSFDHNAVDEFAEALTITAPSGDPAQVTESKPEMKGTVEAGSTVEVVIKDSKGAPVADADGIAVVDANGNWTFTPGKSLPDGDYTIEVIAEKGGKKATKTKGLKVAVPVPPVSITEPSGSLITVAKPEFKGTTAPGAAVTVEIKDKDGKVVATPVVTVNPDGTWSFTPDTELPDGDYTVEVVAEKDGKKSEVLKKSVKVDTALPTLAITEPSGNTVVVAKPEFKGTTTPGAAVTVEIKDKDGKVVATPTVAVKADGTWSFTPDTNLPDGDYSVEVIAEKDGKKSEVLKKNVKVDTVLPTLAITEPSGNTVVVAKPEFKGTTTSGSVVTVEIKDKDGKVVGTPVVTVNPDGTWSFTPDTDLPDGDYTVEVVAEKDGKKFTESKPFTVDTALPTLAINEPSGNKVIVAKPEFKGITVPGATVTVEVKDKDGKVVGTPVVTVNPDGTWSFTPDTDLPDGDYTVEVVAEKDGKKFTESKPFRVDTSDHSVLSGLELNSWDGAPIELSPVFNASNTSYSASVVNSVYSATIYPTTLDPKAKIEITVNNAVYHEIPNGPAGFNLLLDVGINTIVVKVTDTEGKVTEYTLTVTRASADGGNTGGNNGGGTPAPVTPVTPALPITSPIGLGIITSVNDKNDAFASGKLSEDAKQTLVQVDLNKLNAILSQGTGQKLAIQSPNEGAVKVEGLTAETVKQLADKGASLEISNPLAIYPVPGGKMDLNVVSGQLGNAALRDIAVHIDIARSSDALINSAKSKAAAQGYELLVDPVNLDLSFSHNGKTVKSDQLNGYSSKYIALPEGIDPNRITTGVIVNPDGSVFHVPTVVTKINNRYYAWIKDLHSHASYSVIWNPQDFDDVKSHWGQADVNNIAARLSLKGNGDNTFSPNRNVTRSEFSEIVVTGLGLMRQDAPGRIFPDIPASAWYQNAVTIANEFGIVLGYNDGNFFGNQQITREQGIAMIARAYKLIEPQTALSQQEIDSLLVNYKDAAHISAWARADIAQMIAAGIVEGSGSQLLTPKANMTRAEVTALIARLLKTTSLIDK